MTLVDHDDVFETLAADRTDESLDLGRLPRCAWRARYLLDTEAAHSVPEPPAVDSVAMAQKVSGGRVDEESFDDLLRGPLSGGVLGDVEVDYLPSLVVEH